MTIQEVLADITRKIDDAMSGPDAEIIIDDIEWFEMMENRRTGILICSNIDDIPRAKLAFDFSKRGAGFVYRDLYEEWSRERIIREVY